MQIIRIIISGGRARIVEVSEKPKRKPSIPALLRSMPKALLAKALRIPPEKGEHTDV